MKEIIEWIDASERLPEKNKEALVYDSDSGCLIGYYDGELFGAPLFCSDRGSLTNVTHWAELPKGPTKENKQ